ncbi:MAG: hypothetical protein JSV20_05660 [Candidatus Bathyarchaeota archaeon]|nr:MAG: hypothetical protein JSV20_05660 [Candidatus Bathyarchaeota archaeon]
MKVEAIRLGLKRIPEEPQLRPRTWRHETINVKGKLRSIFRDLKTGRFIKKPF